jgi:DNA-binding response OmpR family regulator
MFPAYLSGMDVALIQWPSDEALRQEFARLQQPRLLLVDPDAEPPDVSDALEDWVRLPVSRVDRNARIRALESRVGVAKPPLPVLDGAGTLEYRGGTAQLSILQVAVMRPLIERFGAVVARGALIAAAWPGTEATGNNLDVTIGRLRRQLLPIGLQIRTIRSRGYLLTDANGDR